MTLRNYPKSRFFAVAAHKGQMYGDHKYEYHLDWVVKLIRRYFPLYKAQLDLSLADAIDAGYLHDTMEDTEVTIVDLENEFNTTVALTVHGVTDEEGANRKERKARTYPKIKSDDGALFIKLCDRLANAQAGLDSNTSLLQMYKKEQASFREALYTVGKFEEMWEDLESVLNRAK